MTFMNSTPKMQYNQKQEKTLAKSLQIASSVKSRRKQSSKVCCSNWLLNIPFKLYNEVSPEMLIY